VHQRPGHDATLGPGRGAMTLRAATAGAAPGRRRPPPPPGEPRAVAPGHGPTARGSSAQQLAQTRMAQPRPVRMAAVARKGQLLWPLWRARAVIVEQCGQFVAAVASKGAATAPRHEGRFNRPAGGRKKDLEEYQRLAQSLRLGWPGRLVSGSWTEASSGKRPRAFRVIETIYCII
jgi:hypothetical protein